MASNRYSICPSHTLQQTPLKLVAFQQLVNRLLLAPRSLLAWSLPRSDTFSGSSLPAALFRGPLSSSSQHYPALISSWTKLIHVRP